MIKYAVRLIPVALLALLLGVGGSVHAQTIEVGEPVGAVPTLPDAMGNNLPMQNLMMLTATGIIAILAGAYILRIQLSDQSKTQEIFRTFSFFS